MSVSTQTSAIWRSLFETSQGGSASPRPATVFGPCSAESEAQVLSTAQALASAFPNNIFRAGVWKPRSRPGHFEGAGDAALGWLQQVQKKYAMPVATEVANPIHVEKCLKAGIDVVWIGARTTVNPFAVQEIAEALAGTGIPVLVKNPINPDLPLWIGAVERILRTAKSPAAAIHRGFHSHESSVYRNSPRWELVIDFMSAMPGIAVVCDASHISGDPILIPQVAQKALDLDMHGLMIETHPNPSKALSDARQQITPEALQKLVSTLVVRQVDSEDQDFHRKLIELRSRVDSTDDALLQALATRIKLIQEIGSYKKAHDVTILQLKRWEEILQRQQRASIEAGVDAEFVRKLYTLIHEESIRIQTEILNKR